MDEDASDLDALIRRVDPDRWMSSRFIAELGKRADVVVLYAFDHELARAPKVASNALIAEMRLTWWHEVLAEIFENRPVRRHPTALALAEVVRRRGLAREKLEPLIEARYRELDPSPMSEAEARTWAEETGGAVAEIVGGLLDPKSDVAGARLAGAAWALGRMAAHAPALGLVFRRTLAAARAAAPTLSAQAFPAIAHATLAKRPTGSELAKRLRVTLAVARGRI